MFVNKIGKDHLDIGMNCQDYGFNTKDERLVCDGCSEGKHSEIGAKLFSHIMKNCKPNVDTDFVFKGYINYLFYKMIDLLGNDITTLKDYLSFTILYCQKTESAHFVSVCGDGYIIIEDLNGDISFKKIDDGEYPKYYVYNFIEDKSKLKCYADGVDFKEYYYDRNIYNNVGVASDGIRFIVESEDEELKQQFIDILKSRSEIKMKRFINKNQSLFKDDVTISF